MKVAYRNITRTASGVAAGHGGSGGRPTTMGPRPPTTPSFGTPPPPPPPGYCPLAGFCRDFDAIDVIDGSVYAFKGTVPCLACN